MLSFMIIDISKGCKITIKSTAVSTQWRRLIILNHVPALVCVLLLRDALETRSGVLSTQVLQEFFVVSTRKLGVRPESARRKIELLSTLDVVRPQVADVLAAVDLHRLHDISFWDGLILRAAQIAGCRVLLTEDLQHGRLYDGVRVENPFLES